MILQDLRDGLSQECTDVDDIVLFVRKWLPAEMSLAPYTEITITSKFELTKMHELLKYIDFFLLYRGCRIPYSTFGNIRNSSR